ncbi:methyltransferase domain-containing protein [[Phormidium] sp. ETS-05]|uniref:methyltransferase domain-containing protein n=1 Tax=[Phormidium] sp. ETS-05 TaxID=222819 RepID=UPI0018EEDB87|nr:methyltransferase domain-containing protein [[Phormidium] sp. ETS-05]
MKCKICQSGSEIFAKAKVLNKYDVDYFQCTVCGFVQTEPPYWLEKAYASAIAKSDVGLVQRNLAFSEISSNLIGHLFNSDGNFLDYGGGYGLFVRRMRDLGFNFLWYDKYCENLFAVGFEAENLKSSKYELVTAFEVFEHLIDPLEEIEKLLELSGNILFSTEVLPSSNPKPGEWWYYALEEGQHIAIYTMQSLSVIAKKYNLNLYSNGFLHLLTSKFFDNDLFYGLVTREKITYVKKRSLLNQDYLKIIGSDSEPDDAEKTTGYSLKTPTDNQPTIVIDAVFFQLYKTGIARVWRSLLQEWSNQEFAKHIVVLDRVGTAPKIPGIRYRTIPAYDYGDTDADKQMLQEICDEEGADVFISTYYTTPVSTPSVFMAYDMIPEMLGADFNEPMWREKHYGIQHASAYISISENTAQDLAKFFPSIKPDSITVAHCGVAQEFSSATPEEINHFKTKYGISKPYFLLVGMGSNYKNAILFLKAFSQLPTKQGFEIVATGSGYLLSVEMRQYTSGVVVHLLQLEDAELKAAYSGAVALVYPSIYEGFGLPVLEAIACGCPVITCPNASIPEVAGEAAIYVNHQDVDGLANAMCDVQKPSLRNSMIAAGLAQAQKFSWASMAENVSQALINATLQPLHLQAVNLIIFPDWQQPEESLGAELQAVVKTVATHPDKSRMTLLVYRGEISEEDVNLMLSTVAMNLLMAEDLDVSEGPVISLVGELGPMQWQALLPKLQARIALQCDNEGAIAAAQAENLPTYTPENLP